MFVVRPIRQDDLDDLIKLAAQTGPGMTSLPHEINSLRSFIETSLNSFNTNPEKPGEESYRLVLEDIENKTVIGVAGIKARTGGCQPSYSYAIKKAKHISKNLNVDKEIPYLELVKEFDGPSMIGSLFISPKYRKKKLGILLSLSRFLFIADRRNRFSDSIIAEMRGVIHDNGLCPFWEATVKHFFDMEYAQADFLSAQDKGFIAELMPKYPIYIPLLPTSIQSIIGKVHQDTLSALELLKSQGFKEDEHVDIFDAGPRIAAQVDNIASIKNSQIKKIIIDKIESNQSKILSNIKVDFRCIKCPVVENNDTVRINQEAALALEVENHDEVRIY